MSKHQILQSGSPSLYDSISSEFPCWLGAKPSIQRLIQKQMTQLNEKLLV